MRRHRIWIALFGLPLLNACGASTSGQTFNPFPANSASASQANPVTGSTGAFSNCAGAQIYSTDPTFAAAYQSATLCMTAPAGPAVQLNVTSAVPSGTSLCVVPFVYSADLPAVCEPVINGSATFILSTTQYTSAVVLPQPDLNSYETYLVTPGTMAPSRVLFSL